MKLVRVSTHHWSVSLLLRIGVEVDLHGVEFLFGEELLGDVGYDLFYVGKSVGELYSYDDSLDVITTHAAHTRIFGSYHTCVELLTQAGSVVGGSCVEQIFLAAA